MGGIDLHVHSTYSDGTYTPTELIDYAIEKGLKAIALTDHDTVDGLEEFIEYARGKSIEAIPGIEFSTEYNGRDVHIVGLFIDYRASVFIDYLERFKRSRTERNYKLCTNLRNAGLDITYEALLEAFPNAVITRAHYASFLMDKGYVKSRNEAFDRYLGDYTPYFVHREKITPEEVIKVTLKAGGIPVLAHPTLYRLGQEQLDILVNRLKGKGLMGIEVEYSTYSTADQKQIRDLAKKYHLLFSGGSDFHGENKPGLDLSTGYGRLYVHEDILAKMKRALETKMLLTDLDETLLTTDKRITDKTRTKIIEMLARGNHFVLASGRPINNIFKILQMLDIKEADIKQAYDRLDEREKICTDNLKFKLGRIYAIAYNGATIYDCMDLPYELKSYTVPINTAQAIFDMAIDLNIHIQTYTDTHIVSSADDPELAFYTNFIKSGYIIETKLGNVLLRDPYKLLAICLDDRAKLEKLRDVVEASEIGEDITCAFSNAQYLEFYHKKAGKGNAMLNLCHELNVHVNNTVAVGDEENDISMIRAAAVGVCMANGSTIVKQCADYITENDNNNDGIVEVIERFI